MSAQLPGIHVYVYLCFCLYLYIYVHVCVNTCLCTVSFCAGCVLSQASGPRFCGNAPWKHTRTPPVTPGSGVLILSLSFSSSMGDADEF